MREKTRTLTTCTLKWSKRSCEEPVLQSQLRHNRKTALADTNKKNLFNATEIIWNLILTFLFFCVVLIVIVLCFSKGSSLRECQTCLCHPVIYRSSTGWKLMHISFLVHLQYKKNVQQTILFVQTSLLQQRLKLGVVGVEIFEPSRYKKHQNWYVPSWHAVCHWGVWVEVVR